MTMDSGSELGSLANYIRVKFLGETTSFDRASEAVVEKSESTAKRIKEIYGDAQRYILRSIGIVGIGYGIEKSIEDATNLVSLQRVQAQVLTNQYKGTAQYSKLQIEGAKKQVFWYSQLLDKQATYESVHTGIAKQQIVQAQTLLLTNKDLATLFSRGKSFSGKEPGKEALKGVNETYQNVLEAAANMSAVTGQGISASAKMLGRVLSDPAKRISMMNRGAVQLTLEEQNYVKQVEAANGKMAARVAVIDLINKHIAGAAESAKSPLERLKNDIELLMTQFGKVFLPMFDALAEVLSGVVQVFGPVLAQLGTVMNVIGAQIGNSLGNILSAFEPIINLFVNTLLPALFTVLNPILLLVSAVAQPLAKMFGELFGSGKKAGPVAQAITNIANAMAGPLLNAVKPVGKMFSQLFGSKQFVNSIVGIFAALQPLIGILPELVSLFVQLIVQALPVAIQMLPIFIKVLQIVASIIGQLAKAAGWLITQFTQLTTHVGKLKDVMTGLVIGLSAIWFGSKFVNPLVKVIGLVSKLGKGVGGVMKFATGGFHWKKAENAEGELTKDAKRAAAIEKDAAKLGKERGMLSRILHGGKSPLGLFKSVLGIGLDTALQPKNQLDATNANTQALNNLTNAIQNGGGLLGGGGSNPLSGVEDKLKGKVEGELKSKLEKKFGGKLMEKLGPKLLGRLGKFGKLGRLAGLGEEAASLGEGAAVAGGEGLAEGGLMAGLGGVAAGTGIGLAVVAAGAAYWKWHKTINKAVIGAAKHLYHAAQRVGHWASIEGHHLWNATKDVAKFGGRVIGSVGHAAMSVVSGGIHAAGSILHGVGSAIGGFFGGLFGGGGGGGSHAGSSAAASLRNINTLHVQHLYVHAQHAMRGMHGRGGNGNLVIEKGAFVITVNGSAHPEEHAKMVQKVVNDNMKELQRVLQSMGRGLF